jgi:hypothetical protein
MFQAMLTSKVNAIDKLIADGAVNRLQSILSWLGDGLQGLLDRVCYRLPELN